MWGRCSEHSTVVWNCASLGSYSEGNRGTIRSSTALAQPLWSSWDENHALQLSASRLVWLSNSSNTQVVVTACCPPGPWSLLLWTQRFDPTAQLHQHQGAAKHSHFFPQLKLLNLSSSRMQQHNEYPLSKTDYEQWPIPHLHSRN